jgi:MSHA biogenesis protein MshI
MKLPWQKRGSGERLVVGSSADRFIYVQAGADGRLRRAGVEERGSDTPAEFARRLRGLGLASKQVCAVLPLAQAQFVQLDAPAVRPEEMRAAARWKAKDLLEGRLDEMTIDVMFVGDDRPRPKRQIFVTAAANATIRGVGERLQAAGMELSVVDIAETAQRNLQCAQARAEGLGQRATAALVRHEGQCLLTICAGDELYHARRLEWQGLAVPVAAPANEELAITEMAGVDFVDYGADPQGPGLGGSAAPALVIELQRSLDLWERSWPELPLAALWVHAGDDTHVLASLLTGSVGQPVGRLDLDRILPGHDTVCSTPALRHALLPIQGALLRNEVRRL